MQYSMYMVKNNYLLGDQIDYCLHSKFPEKHYLKKKPCGIFIILFDRNRIDK